MNEYRAESKPLFVLETYRAIKYHFEGSYDFFKYRGKLVVERSRLNFDNSREYHYCVSIAKNRTKVDIVNLLLANILHYPNVWLDVISDEEGVLVYDKWKKKQDSLAYIFTSDIKKVLSEEGVFNDHFKPINNEYPKILQLSISEEISIETTLILDRLMKFLPSLYSTYKNDFLFEGYFRKISKYKEFFFRYHNFNQESISRFKILTLDLYKNARAY